MNLVRIPTTTFRMGHDAGLDNERPVHRVTVDAFEIADCAVTCGELDAFLAATGAERRTFSKDRHPAVNVSWFDTVAYCEWLTRTTARAFRLPTEAEWECAARGGVEGQLYPWGDEIPPAHASRWNDGPEPVGQREPNAYGLYDMCENVHEWCSDWYDPAFYAQSPSSNPKGPGTGTRRTSRGGSWRHQIKASRCSARSSLLPHLRYADYGFRVAASIVCPTRSGEEGGVAAGVEL
jgi:formylglycine-generating enzyme required for sulfatase activity